MPRRTLRDTINTSPHVDKLDFAAEVFYRRLMSEVDDYGRFEALPVIVRAKCYPLRADRIRETDLIRWLAACQDADLIRLYEVDEAGVSRQIPSEGLVAGAAVLAHNSFLVMLRVEPPRALMPKHPEPPDHVICWRPTGDKRKPGAYRRLSKNENICAQAKTDASYSSSLSLSSSTSLNPPDPPSQGGDPPKENSGKQPRLSAAERKSKATEDAIEQKFIELKRAQEACK